MEDLVLASSTYKWDPQHLSEAIRICAEVGSVYETAKLLSSTWGWTVTVPAIENVFRRNGIKWPELVKAKNQERLDALVGKYASAPPPIPHHASPIIEPFKPQPKVELDREFLRYAPSTPPEKKGAKTKGKAAKIRRGVVITDAHVPYNHSRAWYCALGMIKDWNPSFGLILGDFGDLEALSRHPKSKPDLVRLGAEYYAMNVALDELQGSAPNADWTYLEGNHENRAVRFCNEQGTFDGMLTVPEQLYILPKAESYHRSATGNLRGMVWIPEKEVYKTEFAAFHHGSFSSAMHHAAWHANTFGPNKAPGLPIFYGHNHSSQLFQSGSGVYARCCGWLGDVDRVPQDKKGRPRPWVHGIVLLEVADGIMSHHFIRIVNGRAIHNDRIWTAEIGGAV